MNISKLRAEAAQVEIPPLNCKKQTTGKPYERFPDVQKEIEETLSGSGDDRPIRDLKSETIVFFVRRSIEIDDYEVVGYLLEELGRRTSRIISDNIRGFDDSTADQIAFDVSSKVTELLVARSPSTQSEYLERAFRKKVRQLTLNQIQKTNNQIEKSKDRPKTYFSGHQGETEDSFGKNAVNLDGFEGNSPLPDEALIRAETCELIRQHLSQISDVRYRDAVILRYLQGWPYECADKSKPSLCDHFGVSDKTIKSWIEKAFSEMRLALGNQI